MANQPFGDFLPPELRKFADDSVQQAKKAFDDWMGVTQRAVSNFEAHATSTQAAALDLQRKVVSYSERNVGASLEFARRLWQARAPEDVVKLHAEYVKSQVEALTEQAREIAQHAAKAARPDKE